MVCSRGQASPPWAAPFRCARAGWRPPRRASAAYPLAIAHVTMHTRAGKAAWPAVRALSRNRAAAARPASTAAAAKSPAADVAAPGGIRDDNSTAGQAMAAAAQAPLFPMTQRTQAWCGLKSAMRGRPR